MTQRGVSCLCHAGSTLLYSGNVRLKRSIESYGRSSAKFGGSPVYCSFATQREASWIPTRSRVTEKNRHATRVVYRSRNYWRFVDIIDVCESASFLRRRRRRRQVVDLRGSIETFDDFLSELITKQVSNITCNF